MKNKKIVLASLEDTEKLAQNFAALLKKNNPGPIVFNLNGDLGSGKTTFTRFFVEALTGYKDVHSPTFTLMNIYPEDIYHFDFYRLDSEEDLVGINIEEYLPPEKGHTIIEWGDKFNDILPEDMVNIDFFYLDNSREAIISSYYEFDFLEQL